MTNYFDQTTMGHLAQCVWTSTLDGRASTAPTLFVVWQMVSVAEAMEAEEERTGFSAFSGYQAHLQQPTSWSLYVYICVCMYSRFHMQSSSNDLWCAGGSLRAVHDSSLEAALGVVRRIVLTPRIAKMLGDCGASQAIARFLFSVSVGHCCRRWFKLGSGNVVHESLSH